jgi:hypothetical protein
MKLQELAAQQQSKTITKVIESHFGSLNIDRLDRRQSRHMLSRVREILGEHRSSFARHTSERDPAYLKLVMMEQALVSRLREMTAPSTGATPAAQPAAGGSQSAKPMDPKLKAAKEKLAKKLTLTPQEQEMINAEVAAVAENRLRRAYRTLKESEVQQAQVVLAAQDMVDKVQGMLEDVSELQFKELPALVDSIRNQIGAEQAAQFNADAAAALNGLMQNLQGTKTQLETALGVVTGQGPVDMADSLGVDAGAEPAADMGGEVDLDAELDIDANLEPQEEPEEEPAGTLGRARR